MKKINWKQPKYYFPAIIFIPVVGLCYWVFQACSGNEHQQEQVATDHINMNLPEARVNGVEDKMSSMTSRYNNDNAFTVIDGIGTEIEEKESLDGGYSDEELNAMIAEAERRETERRQIEEMQREIAATHQRLPTSQNPYRDPGYNAYMEEMERIQRNSIDRQREIERQEEEERLAKLEAERLARLKEEEDAEKNRPQLVVKANGHNRETFNTIINETTGEATNLIRAMIDVTTKAHEGTRLRFKLLDDVMIGNIKLLKGTYLYGTVSGFGQQRVMANISSILVGDRFLKVDLSVFDNDGMEGFYVPASAFRDFMKQAGSNVLGSNLQFSSGGYGSTLNGESLALQALQNIYSSGTNALTANIRKNKAKIKYNTIVYLINSQEARY